MAVALGLAAGTALGLVLSGFLSDSRTAFADPASPVGPVSSPPPRTLAGPSRSSASGPGLAANLASASPLAGGAAGIDVSAAPPSPSSALSASFLSEFVVGTGPMVPLASASLADSLVSMPLPVAAVQDPASASAVLAAPAPPASPPPSAVIDGVLAKGETIITALARHGISSKTAVRIARELRPHFDFRRARPGHQWRVQTDATGQVVAFRYEVSNAEHYELTAEAGGQIWRASEAKAGTLRQQARLAGVVATTLGDAIEDLGERPELAADLAGIFAWDLDVQKRVRAGDEFRILYERNYKRRPQGGLRYVGPGRILAARYKPVSGPALEAIYYETEPGQGGYFRPDGRSVKQAFLAAPLNYQRITSSFTSARFHPILKVTRAHPGIDYAAPVGSPVWSVANGTVTHVGWMGGYGRLVKIEHPGGYETYYAHLSRYAKNLQVGDTVRQKQVIGFVGSSGLSTGPHVCFRIAKNGSWVDPTQVRIPTGDRVPYRQRQEFETVREARLAQLLPAAVAATDEAM